MYHKIDHNKDRRVINSNSRACALHAQGREIDTFVIIDNLMHI